MEFLKQWTMCVCITLVVSVIFLILTPNGKMKAFYKIIISLFIFISFLYPFKSFNVEAFDFSVVFDIEDYQSTQESEYEALINNEVKNTLKNNNILGSSVSSDVTLKDDEITINKVQIAVSDEYELENVKNIVFDSLGINATVIYIGQ